MFHLKNAFVLLRPLLTGVYIGMRIIASHHCIRSSHSVVASGRPSLLVSLITLCVSSDRKCSRQVEEVDLFCFRSRNIVERFRTTASWTTAEWNPVKGFTGFHSGVVQELTPADCQSLNRKWDSCGAPIHSQRLLRQGKDARSKLFLQQKAASTNNKQLTRQTCLSAACGLCLHPSAASKSLSVFEARQNVSSECKRSKKQGFFCSRRLQVQTISSSQNRCLFVSCLWFALASFC